MRRSFLFFFILIALASSVSAQNTTVTAIDNNTRITDVVWDTRSVHIAVESDLPRQASFVDVSAFTGGGVTTVTPKRITLTAGRVTNVTVPVENSMLGRGVSVNIGGRLAVVKESALDILPKATQFRMLISMLGGGVAVFVVMFAFVRRKKSKNENSMRQLL